MASTTGLQCSPKHDKGCAILHQAPRRRKKCINLQYRRLWTMKKRTAPKDRRTSSQALAPADAGPARVPGIRVAHIGGRAATVEPIRAYWLARGAVFMHHSLEPGEPQRRLEEILERSHIVFHARVGAGCALGRSLERYCDRRGKPLILLEANSLPAVADALAASLPLT
jgi:hypothetical protein